MANRAHEQNFEDSAQSDGDVPTGSRKSPARPDGGDEEQGEGEASETPGIDLERDATQLKKGPSLLDWLARVFGRDS